MNVLVTGGTGLVGTELVGRLVERGDDVAALVRPATLADTRRVSRLEHRDEIRLARGDVEDAAALRRAVKGAEVVYHLAAVRDSHSRELTAVNVEGTDALIQACIGEGVRRVVLTSSVAVYGYRQPRLRWPIAEDAPLDGRMAYARSKIGAERHLRAAAKQRDLDYLILRPSMVYSDRASYFDDLVRQVARDPLRAAARAAHATTQPTHVRDLCDALVLAGTTRGRLRRTLNAVGAEHVPSRQLIHLIAKALDDTVPEPAPDQAPRELVDLKYDLRRAQEVLGFRPAVTLERGVAEAATTIDAARTHALPHRRRSWQAQAERWPGHWRDGRDNQLLGMAGWR
jgi:nucleoside-diphosphate-sugar epimerase